MNNLFALIQTHFFALFLESLWGTCEHWERVEVHWNKCVHSWEEVLGSIGGLSWTHTQAVTDGHQSDIGLVQFIYQFHV